ncbi:MAG: HlyD family efflux transporter periplasmic adaptor subunit [Planctomycetales bacterium]|nr:HlyD family efflux transporter periplasmic adaptor subunit [Planctomycetales bacterium]
MSPSVAAESDPTRLDVTPRTIGFPIGNVPVNKPIDARSRATSDVSLQRASQSTATGHPVSPEAVRPPRPRRAKGRWFISCVIGSVILTVAFGLWNEFLRYVAYGHIAGDVVDVAAPWEGTIVALHVEDGEHVRQGQLLATLENTELKLRLGKLQDEIALARASFDLRVAELKADERDRAESALRVHVDYFELLSRYRQENSREESLRAAYERMLMLSDDHVVARGDVEDARYAWEGQAARVTELKTAVEKMKAGLARVSWAPHDQEQLQSESRRLQVLVEEWERLAQHEKMGQVRAPVSGRVMSRHQLAGEYVDASTCILALLTDGTLRAELYFRQRHAATLAVGQRINVAIRPYHKPMPFVFQRLDDETAPAPPSLRRFYRADARMVVAHAVPASDLSIDTQGDNAVWLGAEVQVPRSLGIAELAHQCWKQWHAATRERSEL